jgi:hypothetical protein
VKPSSYFNSLGYLGKRFLVAPSIFTCKLSKDLGAADFDGVVAGQYDASSSLEA